MQKESNEKRKVNIIYPNTLRFAPPEKLVLCEIVITTLIKTNTDEVYFKMHQDLGYVECKEPELKNVLTLLLKSKKIDIFYDQFTRLLHPLDGSPNHNILGQLVLEQDNNLLNFIVKEEDVLPNFKWIIMRSMSNK